MVGCIPNKKFIRNNIQNGSSDSIKDVDEAKETVKTTPRRTRQRNKRTK